MFKALNRILIPGEIAPPAYEASLSTKSKVMQVPASITKTFLLGNCFTAPATKAILSTPNVFGVLYKFLKGIFKDEESTKKLKLLFNCSILFSEIDPTFEMIPLEIECFLIIFLVSETIIFLSKISSSNSLSSSKTAALTLVFPISIARFMGQI